MDVSPAEIGSVWKAENIMARKRTYRAQIEHVPLDNDPLRPPHQCSLRLVPQLLFIPDHAISQRTPRLIMQNCGSGADESAQNDGDANEVLVEVGCGDGHGVRRGGVPLEQLVTRERVFENTTPPPGTPSPQPSA
jgi:hypothetical protein